MFNKLVAIEPVSLVDTAIEELNSYAKEIVMFDNIPADDDEIVRRIGDADAVLVSYTSRINSSVMEKCSNIRYIGMCCSLYSKESANVDIAYAEEHNIIVKGIRDYGDRGVVEFVLSELVRFLHGYDRPMFLDMPIEILGLKVGIIGLGVSGGMIADALNFMGADISYFSRTRKPEFEDKGLTYSPLHELLENNDVVFMCLNKNVILLKDEEFEKLGSHKILFNTSIGPAHETEALKKWLKNKENYFVCDTRGAIGEDADSIVELSNVFCQDYSAGRTKQAFVLLSRKVLDNIKVALTELK